jgi:ribosomal protein S18 acetylase RimI-like enzyme
VAAPGPAPRLAGEADLDAIGETLARAFENDRAWGWAFEDGGRTVEPERKLAALRAIFRFSAAAALGYGWVRVTEGVEAVALWIPPGEPEMSAADAQRFPLLVREVCDEATAARLFQVMEGFDRLRPAAPPHYFLSTLGTHPDHAGHGHGLGLLAANLAEIDAAAGRAFLETAKPHNVGLYERFGFRVEREAEVLPGIAATTMWRQARG